MGSVFSRPAAAAATPTVLPTLTIRNLTVTPLELRLVEHLKSVHHHHPHLHKPNGLVKTSSRSSNPEQSHEQPDAPLPSTATPVSGTIEPFSECRTAVYAPDAARHEQLRLTFEDPATGHRYSADIPGSSRRSIVLKAHHPAGAGDGETKEFTAIYLPEHAYLALFSSANLSSWMSTLDPALPLSALSIPGTHNSPTCYVALPSVRCQAVSVLDQLNNGVRFLDVRVSCPPYRASTVSAPSNSSPKGGEEEEGEEEQEGGGEGTRVPELALVHSAFPVSLTGPKYLSGLLATVYDFLAAHPTETVLLSLKREGTGRGSDADLARILHRHYVRPRRDRWYTAPRVPTLAQCRGRVVLVRRFGLGRSPAAVPASEAGIDGSAWPDNVADGTCGSGTIRIQDYYGVGSGSDIQKKLRYAQEGLARAAAQAQAVVAEVRSSSSSSSSSSSAAAAATTPLPPPPPLFINFLSASNFFNASCWPERIAFKINPSMIEYLCMKHGTEGKGSGEFGAGDAVTGIVVTDWVGHRGDWDLLRCIVGWNARLQLRQ
ncbi:hypothetical protein MYCTH_2294314 [Thermothelomyces thermophilus ATCC 42464]|uniref:Phosphatidylinositol-specific phospholipase C X domain-containing protein n=1 Tax=Thermothelomyces thermophilus (strain ATCC 42464 / BCRC 31852 / DSM 1799) TaxID=573729 RepID=G2Q0U6_THET4|nr:uncharacterized protein MYCTH_2294314 [Thermothelomyces thermophilus ATCC 42464]AEO53246.1 hypothetical protein MYCTH_2294314 [Thermothelomyces thermophilus ATCC 42464]